MIINIENTEPYPDFQHMSSGGAFQSPYGKPTGTLISFVRFGVQQSSPPHCPGGHAGSGLRRRRLHGILLLLGTSQPMPQSMGAQRGTDGTPCFPCNLGCSEFPVIWFSRIPAVLGFLARRQETVLVAVIWHGWIRMASPAEIPVVKLQAWSDLDRRQGKQTKNLGDIARLVESCPDFLAQLGQYLQQRIGQPI